MKEDIPSKLAELIRNERKCTNDLLILINRAVEQKAFAEPGYTSMFDWLVRGFHYSNAAAQRRIHAARMIRTCPEATEKLAAGTINLTNLSKVQQIVQEHEKISGVKVSITKRSDLLKKIENKTAFETEQMLAIEFPLTAPAIEPDRRIPIDETILAIP